LSRRRVAGRDQDGLPGFANGALNFTAGAFMLAAHDRGGLCEAPRLASIELRVYHPGEQYMKPYLIRIVIAVLSVWLAAAATAAPKDGKAESKQARKGVSQQRSADRKPSEVELADRQQQQERRQTASDDDAGQRTQDREAATDRDKARDNQRNRDATGRDDDDDDGQGSQAGSGASNAGRGSEQGQAMGARRDERKEIQEEYREGREPGQESRQAGEKTKKPWWKFWESSSDEGAQE
jgi:hypothetical protein